MSDDLWTISRQRVAESLRIFDNHDSRLPYYELVLEGTLDDLPVFPLPEGYHLAYYRPGDRENWIAIETSAREFHCREEGLRAWEQYYANHEDEMPERMLFAVNARGEPVATATAFYDVRRPDDGVNGMLHWVAVRREDQGKGLSKPLIAQTLRRLKELGYKRAAIPTQTTTWLACKVYLDLGFRPIPRNAERSRAGWEIVRALTAHPALTDFAEADLTKWQTEPKAGEMGGQGI